MKRPSLRSLRNKLDKCFSAYIRRRDCLPSGEGYCVSCRSFTKLQCGHWIKRGHSATRWDERNAAGQCARCNLFLNGAQDEFAAAIVRKHGVEVLNELIRLKHTTVKFSRSDLEEMISKYG